MNFVSKVVMSQQASATAHWFVCADNQVFLRRGTFEGLAQLPSTAELNDLDLTEAQLIGELDGEQCLALSLDKMNGLSGFEPVGLRSLWARLDEQLFGIAGRANQLAHFARNHRFCGHCGTKTERHPTERAVRCPTCKLVGYPRISPAIITLVRRGDEALLASNARFPGAFFSTLAGFSEVGESLEETLKREVFEEVGLKVQNIRYAGSQSWPFPHSLMIGFHAEHESGEITVDATEISEARFFKAAQLPQIPPKLSIARKLIDEWVEDVLQRR